MSTTSAFEYTRTVGCYALGLFGFTNPVDMALDRDVNLYVVSRGNLDFEDTRSTKRVTVCNVAGELLREFATGGTGDGDIMWPSCIAVNLDANVYISDEALNRISVFSKEGEFLAKWGTRGSGDGEFDRPAGIAFDGDGNLLVVDGLNSRVQRWTADGRFLGSWGKRGTGDGEFNMPWGIAVDSEDNVYVADWRNDRVQKLDPEGRHLATFGSSGGASGGSSGGSSGHGDGELHRPAGVAVDQDGDVYVADWGNERVQVYDSGGDFVAKIRGQSGYSKWAQDWFISNQDLLEERDNANLQPPVQANPWGSFVRDESANVESLLWGPTAVKLDAEGRLFIVDSLRHRIQVYERQGVRPTVS